jgi:hypothetical protein
LFSNIDFASAVAEIAPLLDEWRDPVVPASVESSPNSPYAVDYAWMYAYERGVRRRLERALRRPLGVWQTRLFGQDGVVSEGLSNAFLHGHQRDGSRPIEVRWAVSTKGVAAAIADLGPGFDVPARVRSLERGYGYFNVAGNGLKTFARSEEIHVAFRNGGRELHLLALFSRRR